MSFPYKHVLLIGATSGIGRALTTKLLSSGISVTAVGRRTEILSEIVKSSPSLATSRVFDIDDTAAAPAFAAEVMRAYPTIDCIMLNAGRQRSYDWSDLQKVDLKEFTAEVHTNFTAMVALTHAFLPLLQKTAPRPAAIVYTGAHLGHIPAVTLSAYSASKAALSSFVLCIRDYMRDGNVKIIELAPPVVQCESSPALWASSCRDRTLT